MVVIKVILQMYVVSLFLKYGICSNSTRCNPAEEGTKHTIAFCLDTNNTGLIFYIDNENSLVADCFPSNKSCKDIMNQKFLSTLEKNDTNYYHLRVTMLNVTRDDFGMEGNWSLKVEISPDSKDIMSCRLNIYAKPSDVTCHRNIVDRKLHLNCSTERIYPKLKCDFLTQDIKMKETVSNLHVNYTNINITDTPVYYRSSCAICVELKNERKGTFDITVTMYPNVTGNDGDIIYGTNKTLTLDLEQQGVTITDCPQIIKLYDRVTCRCVVLGSSNKNNSALWFNENQEENITSSNILHFNVTQILKNYTFVCKLLAGNINAIAFYRPYFDDSTVDCSLCPAGSQFHYTCYIIIAVALLLIVCVAYGCNKGVKEKVDRCFLPCKISKIYQICGSRPNEQTNVNSTNVQTRNTPENDTSDSFNDNTSPKSAGKKKFDESYTKEDRDINWDATNNLLQGETEC